MHNVRKKIAKSYIGKVKQGKKSAQISTRNFKGFRNAEVFETFHSLCC